MTDSGSATVPPSSIPVLGQVFSVVLLMTTVAVLAICLTRRLQSVYSWRALPITGWLLIAIYVDSFAFVFFTAVLTKGFNMNVLGICRGTIVLCLVFYMTTKVFVYLFLVEKAYIVRGRIRPRLKDKLYLFNCFGMICPYIGVFVLNFIFRFAYINVKGTCIIGMERVAMVPLLSFEVLVNVYLTSLFLIPLRQLYSYRHNTNTTLRAVALRTFIGSCATLASSVTNITVLIVLNGEPGWVCMMCCNSDILFSVLVLHWVTSIDSTRGPTSQAYPPKSRQSTVDGRPYDGTNGGTRHSCRNCRNQDGVDGSWGVTSQQRDVSERNATAVMTHITADKDADDLRRDIPMDKITVTTERTMHVEIEGESDGNSEASAGGSEIGQRFRNFEEATGSTDYMV